MNRSLKNKLLIRLHGVYFGVDEFTMRIRVKMFSTYLVC